MATTVKPETLVGKKIRRREDPRLITGQRLTHALAQLLRFGDALRFDAQRTRQADEIDLRLHQVHRQVLPVVSSRHCFDEAFYVVERFLDRPMGLFGSDAVGQ